MTQKNTLGITIFLFSYISLLVAFFLNEDGSGGGAAGDFDITYGFVLSLKENILSNPKDWTVVHTPLHFMILSFFTNLIEDAYYLRLLYCSSAFLIPLFFYKTLVLKFENINNNVALIISSSIFFLPAFRYTSIWANDLITSIFFFILSINFFIKWQKTKKNTFSINILFQLFFLVLATYCRQYFAVFFLYFLFIYYQHLNLKVFFLILFGCFLSSIPVLYYTYLFPALATEQFISFKAIPYFLLGNASIMSIYLLPIFLYYLFLKPQEILSKDIFLNLIMPIILVLLLSLYFNPNNWIGGGVIYTLSKNLFHNNYLFLLSSIFTYFVFLLIIQENKFNFLIIFITLFVFFSFQVYQRYYEPMFTVILFLLINTKFVNEFIKNIKPSIYLYIFTIIYYLGSVSDAVHKL
jgi:hypothetical protein